MVDRAFIEALKSVIDRRGSEVRLIAVRDSGLVLEVTAPNGEREIVRVIGPISDTHVLGLIRDLNEHTSGTRFVNYSSLMTAEMRDVGLSALMARPYIERTLKDQLRARRPLSGRRVAEIAIAVNAALAELHAAGLVHGRLTPDNVASVGRLWRLMDFGVGLLTSSSTEGAYAGLRERDLRDFIELLSALANRMDPAEVYYRAALSDIVAEQTRSHRVSQASDLARLLHYRRNRPRLPQARRVVQGRASDLALMAADYIVQREARRWNLVAPHPAVRKTVERVIRDDFAPAIRDAAVANLSLREANALVHAVAEKSAAILYNEGVLDPELRHQGGDVIAERNEDDVERTASALAAALGRNDLLHALQDAEARSVSTMVAGRLALVSDGFTADQLVEVGLDPPTEIAGHAARSITAVRRLIEREFTYSASDIALVEADGLLFESIARLLKGNLLIGWVDASEVPRLPAFQFDPVTLEPSPDVIRVNEVLRSRVGPLGIFSWWLTPNHHLWGMTPRSALVEGLQLERPIGDRLLAAVLDRLEGQSAEETAGSGT